ncbi:MAG: class I SAM-dependent methyltransferase [Pseudomonadota bacterium]
MAGKADWEGAQGESWARNAAVMERMLKPFGAAAMAALGPVEGLSVLDLGCGGGATTLELAARAGADGRVVGLDVSPDLIALAERRKAEAAPAAPVAFRCADAAEARFDEPFDAVYSQFGAMFFDDAAAAWANLRKAAKPGAPLAIACWRAPKENEWATLALGVAKPLLPEAPPVDRFAPGPFAWSEPEATFAPALAKAGWRDVAWRPIDEEIALGAGYGVNGADPAETATDFVMEMGPLSRRLAELDDEKRAEVRAVVAKTLSWRRRGATVPVSGAGWIVTARA